MYLRNSLFIGVAVGWLCLMPPGLQQGKFRLLPGSTQLEKMDLPRTSLGSEGFTGSLLSSAGLGMPKADQGSVSQPSKLLKELADVMGRSSEETLQSKGSSEAKIAKVYTAAKTKLRR
mmetsp:Transcript_47838/g.74695  ORF Transcript_47838/g.74695 Transcript_47838/m.74695 type:complete len:118 (-) Transcript_47838:325-678(-)